jgi:hypothetical protein
MARRPRRNHTAAFKAKVCTRRMKNRPRDAALAASRGGVNVTHAATFWFHGKQGL